MDIKTKADLLALFALTLSDSLVIVSLAPRKKQKSQTKAPEDDIIDITENDSRLQHESTAGPSNLAPSRRRSASKLLIRAELSAPSPPTRPQSSDGGTRHDPIILDSSSPAKPQIAVDITKPTYSIFAPRKPPPQALESPSKPNLRKADNTTLGTPFPDATSQHVRGSQSEFKTLPLPFTRRFPKLEVMGVSAPSGLSSFRESNFDQANLFSPPLGSTDVQTIQPSARNDYIETIPNTHIRDYPAISYLVQLSPSSSTSTEPSSPFPSQDLWTDKWRPRRADHVLGNEHHALYLRDWLSALELQLDSCLESPQKPQPKSKSTTTLVRYETKKGKLNPKEAKSNDNRGVKRQRPRVVRTVQKMKGRKKQRVESDEEDWIVDTDDECGIEDNEYAGLREESEEDEEDDVEFCRKQTLSRLRRFESSPAPPSSTPLSQIQHVPLSSSELHNTLLLTGPSGSGKTAAVYACAKELDWEVFEVYPGVGKRSGVSLEQLVGEVGNNHLVRKAGGVKKDVQGKKNMFVEMFSKGKEKKVGINAAGMHGTVREPVEVEGEGVSVGGTRSNGDFGFVIPKGNIGMDLNAKDQESEPTQGVRQSLILLEEVDILFEEDRGFWSAAINIIKDCRRPVIMTCSGKPFPTQSLTILESDVNGRTRCQPRANFGSPLAKHTIFPSLPASCSSFIPPRYLSRRRPSHRPKLPSQALRIHAQDRYFRYAGLAAEPSQ